MVVAVSNTLSEVYPATAEIVPHARRWAADFATEAGAPPETVEAVKLAVSEAVTNAVVHAYRDEPGQVQLTAAAAGDELCVLVADEGEGHQATPRDPGLGWGLALIADSCDQFMITERSGGGTEVEMRFQLDGRR